MTVPELLDQFRRAGAHLWVDGERLRYRAPAGVITDEMLASLREHKPEVLQILLAAVEATDEVSGNLSDDFPGDSGDGVTPLSYAQQSFWLLEQLYPGEFCAHEQFTIHLDGPLSIRHLEQAWQELVSRHSILRTTIHDDGVAPCQRIHPVSVSSPLLLPVQDCTDRSVEDGQRVLRACAAEELEMPFQLDTGPLIRPVLFHFSFSHHALLVTAHHIIADGLSVRIIRDELADLYRAAVRGHADELIVPTDQYRDFAIAQRRGSDGREARDLDYWRSVLADCPGHLDMPGRLPDRLTGESSLSAHQRRISFSIEPALADRLRRFARESNATVFMAVLAAFRALLFRLSGQVDVPLGSPVTCRDAGATERMIGCLVNNVVFRNSIDGGKGFDELLRREREVTLGALGHKDVPFEKVVDAVQPARTFGRHPLFQVLFLFESDRQSEIQREQVSFRLDTHRDAGSSYWDMEFSVTDHGPGRDMQGFLGYRTQLFESWWSETIPELFLTLLAAALENPQRPVERLTLLSPVSRQKLLADAQGEIEPVTADMTLHSLVDAQVRRTPDRIALCFDQETWTYAELQSRAEIVACRLADRGIGSGALVGIGMRRSADLVIAVLGVLKAGAAYVPLDPAYPADRLAFMMHDTALKVVLTDTGSVQSLPLIDGVEMLCLDIRADGQDTRPGAGPVNIKPADSRAYVLYTSGSTGHPKGTIGLHPGAVSRCRWMWRKYEFGIDDVFCLRTSLNFVDSIWEIFGALMHGARLVILPDELVADPARLPDQLSASGVSHIVMVPSLLRAILDEESASSIRLPALHTWITSGEPLAPQLLERFRAIFPHARLLNTYGTSETWDACCFDTRGWTPVMPSVPIGKPVANVRTYILDRHLEPVPPGMSGELYVGGYGADAGYWNQPDLTQQRFIPDPFADESGASMYRTGDRVRLLGDGNLDCLGRIDRQLKIRGYRVEPGEIESALCRHVQVSQATVVKREVDDGIAQLVAYVVCLCPVPAEDELRRLLRRSLPDYMIPARFVHLDQLPLTPSGKVDRFALPAPEYSPEPGPSFVAPQSELEVLIAAIWSEVLGIEQIGLHDDFFELGGHSLLATRVVSRLRERCDSRFTLQHLFEGSTVAELAAEARHLLAMAHDGRSAAPSLGRVSRELDLPLSFGQERLWFLDQLDSDSPAYNIAFTVHLQGELKLSVLQAAMDALVARHEVLRTTFPASNGRPVQEIMPHLSVPVQFERQSRADEAQWRQRLMDLSRRSFDLARGPLLAVHLLQRSDHSHVLLIVIHHSISDGASNNILFRDLAMFCEAYATGHAPDLPELPVQYADYAHWQRCWLSDERLSSQLAYWTDRLAGAPPALELPTDRPRPADQRFRGAWIRRQMTADQAQTLGTLGREHGCTLFMVMFATFNILLKRYSGQTDLIVGSPVAGRVHPDVDELMGLFINSLVLRTDLSGNPLVSDLLQQVRQTVLDAQAHQELPFEKLVEVLQPDRTLSHAPVFQVMFNLMPVAKRRYSFDGLQMELDRLLDHGISTFDLTLSVGEHEDGLELIFEYDTDLFDAATIERLADHYFNLLSAVTMSVDRPVADLNMLTEHERHQLLHLWNPPLPDQVAPVLVHHRFAAMAAAHPDEPAVVDGRHRIVYGDLDRRANQLANHLQSLGVGSDVRVGLCLDRSVDALVGVLGILKAGGAYVPLDPDYPAERLNFMLENADPAVLVTDAVLASQFQDVSMPVVCMDRHQALLESCADSLPDANVTPEDLAYVLYTSGSTGRPKGVMVTHRNLSGMYEAWASAYQLRPGEAHLQMASLAFDVFTGDWVRALCSGGRLVLCPKMALLDPERLHDLVCSERVRCAEFVPAVLRLLVTWLHGTGQTLSGMRLVLVGSDTWYSKEYLSLRELCGPGVRVINSYGVAEATIDSSYFEAERIADESTPVPIGRPFENARIYICDEDLNLLPVGISGELCIGGTAVARGYINNEPLTAAQFVTDPFVDGGSGRLYRTGDRARFGPGGCVELLGRMDHQLKLRGFRIEPGEIEGMLAQHPGVNQCVVMLVRSPSGDERLVAYVVARTEPVDPVELRAWLKTRLPDYMVPAGFTAMLSLPLTPNGKIDRNSLPAPDWDTAVAARSAAPRTLLESALCSLFAEVLGLDAVGVYDNFFDLGGHSLLAAQLVSRIRDALNVELPLKVLFESPVPTALSTKLTADESTLLPPVRRMPRTKPVELPASFAQQRLWFFDQLEPGSTAYNLHWAAKLDGALDLPALDEAVRLLVLRHEVLRTYFSERDGQPLQCITGQADIQLQVESVDIGADTNSGANSDLEARLARLISQPFDLQQGPLLRVTVLRHSMQSAVLVIVVHHSVADGWSMGVMFRELSLLYNACIENRPNPLPELPVQYADYAIWQRDWLSAEKLEQQLDYWTQTLAGMPPVINLPADGARTVGQARLARWKTKSLSVKLTGELHALACAEHCTLYMVLLAALDALLARYGGQEDIVVGTPVAGRNRTELEGLIGFFVNTLVLRTDLSGNPEFRVLLARVKETALQAFAHQDLPFEKLVEAIGPQRNRAHHPIVQVLFALHNQPAESFQLNGLVAEQVLTQSGTAKFDLSIHAAEDQGRLMLSLNADAGLFSDATLDLLLSGFESLLEAVVVTPRTRLAALPVWTAGNDQPVSPLVDFEAFADEDLAASLVCRFAAQVRRHAARPAVETSEAVLSYSELNEQANRVAHVLLHLDANVAHVGLMCNQGAAPIVGLLGILKAGGAYVPLDLQNPVLRLERLICEADIEVIVADAENAERASALAGVAHVIIMEHCNQPAPDPDVPVSAEHPAYVIYTSGSTGEPKGVMQTHGGVMRQLSRYTGSLHLNAGDRISLLSGVAFDAAVQDIFGALLNGACVLPLDVRADGSAGDLLKQIVAAQITVFHATPTVYRHLFAAERSATPDLSAVRLVVLGGEPVLRHDFELFRMCFVAGTVFVNGLGLTESTLALQFFADHDTRILGQQVPVGSAVDGLKVELLDAQGRSGWMGEIVLTGEGIAAGYWQRPELTATLFETDAGGRTVYRTGDIGQLLPDGQIVCIGRVDDQFKLRGFRIEPAEIAAALYKFAGVASCVILVTKQTGDDDRLVAYVSGTVTESELRIHARKHLPGWMLPQGYVLLGELPRLANGKVDRASLPAPDWSPAVNGALPHTALEEQLAAIWCELLDVDHIGIHDDFFALGGHSLLATRLVSRIRDALSRDISLLSIFEYPSVSALANFLESSRNPDSAPVIKKLSRSDRRMAGQGF
jgi:amino acid adenylation domain-containing protein